MQSFGAKCQKQSKILTLPRISFSDFCSRKAAAQTAQTKYVVEAEPAKLSERVGGGAHVVIHSRSIRIEVCNPWNENEILIWQGLKIGYCASTTIQRFVCVSEYARVFYICSVLSKEGSIQSIINFVAEYIL